MGWPADKVRRVAESFLKLVAIATVADVVPLTGENRIIVTHGLRGLSTVRNPGLRALLDVAGFTVDATPPNARQVAFQLAPRINAAGRMDTAKAVVELFLTNDPARARDLAQTTSRSEHRAPAGGSGDPRHLRTDRPWTPPNARWSTTPRTGTAACSASWPAAWWSASTGPSSCWDGIRTMAWRRARAAASLRSICWTRWNRCRSSSCDSADTRTRPASPWRSRNVEEFRRRFDAYAAARLCADDFLRRLEIDAVLELREINEQAIDELFTLAPFGHGNPAPLFAALGVEVAAPPAIMKEKHLRITVRQNGRSLVLKAWNLAHRASELVPGARVDVAFNLEEDAYSAARGYPPWAAMLRDFRPACGSSAAAGRHSAARQFAAVAGLQDRGKLPPRPHISGCIQFVFCWISARRCSAFAVHGRDARAKRGNQHERGKHMKKSITRLASIATLTTVALLAQGPRPENANRGGGGSGSSNPPDVATIVARQVKFLTTLLTLTTGPGHPGHNHLHRRTERHHSARNPDHHRGDRTVDRHQGEHHGRHHYPGGCNRDGAGPDCRHQGECRRGVLPSADGGPEDQADQLRHRLPGRQIR